MDAERKQKSVETQETRRGFLKKSGKVAAGVAALPIVMTLSPDEARAVGSGGARRRQVRREAQRYARRARGGATRRARRRRSRLLRWLR